MAFFDHLKIGEINLKDLHKDTIWPRLHDVIEGGIVVFMRQPGDFRKKVYTLARQIPYGKVATYGQLARLAGSPWAARAVGMCMKNNPDLTTIPCHRVVASDGSLTGYSAGKGISTKREKLLEEGVSFHGNKVNLQRSLWQNDSQITLV